MAQRIGEWFRLITPILVTIVGCLLGWMRQDFKDDMRDLKAGQLAVNQQVADTRERLAVVEAQVALLKK